MHALHDLYFYDLLCCIAYHLGKASVSYWVTQWLLEMLPHLKTSSDARLIPAYYIFKCSHRYCLSICYVSVFILFQIKYIPPWSTLPSYYQWPYYMPRVDNPWVEGVILEGYWIRYELCHSQNQNIATENLTSKC